MFLPVILAGGSGTRLWPLSNERRPKPFHVLCGERTLLQQTVLRLEGLPALPPFIVCNEGHRFLAAEQMRQIGRDDIIVLLEPLGRNTAPAAALAALLAMADHADPLLLILPSDHHIADVPRFHAALSVATKVAESGRIVTFGIVPDRPDTGFGYIRRGAEIAGKDAFVVAAFEEKPDHDTAARFVENGEHVWNSGIFMVRASRYIEELARHRRDVADACRKAMSAIVRQHPFIRPDTAAFGASPSVSIDHAVMERTDAAAMVPLDAGWSDVGTWEALAQAGPRDVDGNVLNGDIRMLAGRGNFVHAEGLKVALAGVEDLFVVATADGVLVAKRGHPFDAGDLAE